jgi:putative membrane protein
MPSEPPAPPPPPTDGASSSPGGAAPPGPGSAAASHPFATPRRLHPASVVLGINVRQLIQALIFPLAATFTAGWRVMLAALLAMGCILLAARVLAWQRFHYSFDGEVLRVAEGVLSRNQRALDVARIQQVEIDRSLLQRMLGLAALRVETAGSSAEVEVELRVVPDRDAVALRSAVRESKVRTTGTPPAQGDDDPVGGDDAGRLVLSVPLRHVVLGSVTGVRLLVFPAVIAGAFQLLGQATDQWVENGVEYLLEQDVVTERGVQGLSLSTGLLLAAVVLGLSLATAVVVGVLRDAGFRISQVGDDLHVSRGLLSTRDSVLPLRRLQLVQVQRNWIRRMLGHSSVRVHSAGGSGDSDRRVTVPLLPDDRVAGLIAELYPGSTGIPPLTRHPRPAVRRAVLRWLRSLAWPLALLWILPWELAEAARVPALALLPLAVVLGVVEYRHLAHGVSERLVASRQGALSVTTGLAPVVKVQAVTTRESYFQRRLGLATVRVHVAGPGGDVEVLDAAAGAAHDLHARLTHHAADPVQLDAPRPGSRRVRRSPDPPPAATPGSRGGWSPPRAHPGG